MLNWILSAFVGDYNTKQLKKIEPLIVQINDWYGRFDDLSDDEIKEKTQEFKNRLTNGETVDDLLPEAFAVVKQACKRMVGMPIEVKEKKLTWDMVPYDVQLVGGIILHQGKIAEMRTGEGKTLVAVAPVYLNALTGKPVHVVTVNDYLASRDAEWMGYLYNWLGLSVGSITKNTPLQHHKAEYAKDIVYVENTELGFDYLRDNLEQLLEERRLLNHGLYFAIVDEADSVLIDEARTPMIMSQPNNDPVDKYQFFAQIIKNLTPSQSKKKVSKGFIADILKKDAEAEEELPSGDYYIDEKGKTATLSEQGIEKLEKILNIEHLYRDLGYDQIRHIENALLAQAVYENGKDYIVQEGEVVIVDENTGRIMPGRRYQGGLHQAIEAKENLTPKQEAKTIATITYQNFFKLYEKIGGMTGTALTEAEEFEKIYDLETVSIPTNRKVIRADKSDKVYFDQNAKWNAVINSVQFYHEAGVPLLIGTSSVYTSELVSDLLRRKSINHYVLNAKYHEQEANIIENAGKTGSVVVATNMAGRGTDIKLDPVLNEEVAKNYAQWIKKQLDAGNPLKLNVFSEYEYQLLEHELKKLGISL
jgi:preprotein translocase subunit SecA